MSNEISNNELAQMIKQGFDAVDKKFDGFEKKFDNIQKQFENTNDRLDTLDNGQEDIKLRFTHLAHQIDIDDHEKRIRSIEIEIKQLKIAK